jgi:hypothetical protein
MRRGIGPDVSDREHDQPDGGGGGQYPRHKRNRGGQGHPSATPEQQRPHGQDGRRRGERKRAAPDREDPAQPSALARD